MDFKKIIQEQREELEKIEKEENLVQREGYEIARKALSYPNILAVLGTRRSGKSIFSYLLAKNYNFAYLNFDDERLTDLQKEDFDKILSAFYEMYGDIDYIILDEIQNTDNWELFVNRLRRTKKVIITGSNSKLLSGELSSHLTGRYLDFLLFPFSFREFLIKKSFVYRKIFTTRDTAEILKLFGEFLQLGGFPEVYKFGRIMASRIYEDILVKDIFLRHKIKKTEEFRRLAKYLVTNSSKESTYGRLAKILELRQISTLSQWISYLENAFLIFRFERFSFKLKEQFKSPKKFYCLDTGLINSIGFAFSENQGRILESLAAVELLRKKSTNPMLEVYYWKDHQQNEVDFVVKEGKKITQLIQVCAISSKEELPEREISSLIKASRELKCKNLLVLTYNYEAENKWIRFIPLWKWLLA
ncbi:ATP-binding protein [Candidatus Woesearchaeota archaeon]|nr:ATP-binding protein [Candidatus Woesearchaeota archaeon]